MELEKPLMTLSPEEEKRRLVILCGESAVDEIAHLEPDIAGAALGYAVQWHSVTLELEKSDSAAITFLKEIEKAAQEARLRLEGRVAQEAGMVRA